MAIELRSPPVAGPLLRPAEAALYLGVSIAQFYRLKEAGRIPAPVRISPRVAGYPKSQLDSFIANQMTDAAA